MVVMRKLVLLGVMVFVALARVCVGWCNPADRVQEIGGLPLDMDPLHCGARRVSWQYGVCTEYQSEDF